MAKASRRDQEAEAMMDAAWSDMKAAMMRFQTIAWDLYAKYAEPDFDAVGVREKIGELQTVAAELAAVLDTLIHIDEEGARERGT